jgi:hypothetical protein
MPHPVAQITEQVRERVRRDGVDLGADAALAGRYVRDEVRRYSERALGGSLPLLADERAVEREVVASITGFGPLQPYFDDPEIEELWINAPDRVFIARNGVTERTTLELTDAQVRDLVERMLQSSGRRVDLSSPFVDASLPDGSRLHVVIPDVTQHHWAVIVRKSNDLRLVAFARVVDQVTGALERGTPLAEVLRVQAQDARDDAKRDLLEVAGRKEVAMLVPVNRYPISPRQDARSISRRLNSGSGHSTFSLSARLSFTSL